MRKLFFVLLFGLSIITLASAQDAKPRTNAGDKSILFSLNGFGDFGVTGPVVGTTPLGNSTFDSLASQLGQLMGTRVVRPIYGAGMRFFLTDNTALRIGLGFNLSSNSTPRPNDTTGKEDTDSRFAFGISPALEIHLINAGPVSFYTGVVLSCATASTSQGEDSLKVSNSQPGLGGGALLGAEVFILNNLSLGAEYQVGVLRSSTSNKSGSKSTDGPSSTDIGISGPVRITLGLHF
jgi:hypothetical protein